MASLNEAYPLRVMGAEARADMVIAWKSSMLAGVKSVSINLEQPDVAYTIELLVGGEYGKRRNLIKSLEDWGIKVIQIVDE